MSTPSKLSIRDLQCISRVQRLLNETEKIPLGDKAARIHNACEIYNVLLEYPDVIEGFRYSVNKRFPETAQRKLVEFFEQEPLMRDASLYYLERLFPDTASAIRAKLENL